MAKTYQVTQKVTINGKLNSVTFPFYGEQDDLIAFCGQLAGGYEVKEVVSGLSDLTGIDTNNVSTNPVVSITLSGPQNQFASIRPYKGVIHFKNSINVDEIGNILRNTTPFPLLPTEKPLRVTVKRSETFSAGEAPVGG
jgi:hypothetical protein